MLPRADSCKCKPAPDGALCSVGSLIVVKWHNPVETPVVKLMGCEC